MMIRKNIQQNSGFTLIELLVVVAIIGLLSAIVMTSLNESRLKARNSERNQIVLSYINALELYRTNNDGYPNYGTYQFPMICLGRRGGSDSCHGPWPHVNMSGTFWGEMDLYLPGVPNANQPINSGGDDYSGIAYACSETAGSNCVNYIIRWYLEGTDIGSNCPRGLPPTGAGDLSVCEFDSEGIN